MKIKRSVFISFLLSTLLVSCAEVSFTEVLKGKTLPVTAVHLVSEPTHTGYEMGEYGSLSLLTGLSKSACTEVTLNGIRANAFLSDGSYQLTTDVLVPTVAELSLSEGTTIVPVTINGFSDKANDNTFPVHVFKKHGTINPFAVRVPMFSEQDMALHAIEMEARLSTGLSDYEIARTETTFTLWKEVLDWGKENGYDFASTGTEGSDGTWGADDMGTGQPVASVSLRDVRVWCNALSEMDGLEPVYLGSNGNVLRNSRDGATVEAAVVHSEKNGWRLPSIKEYEFAARGGLCAWYAKSTGVPPCTTFPDDPELSAYDFPYSGAKSTDFLSTYAVYNQYSSAPCASKQKNTLGLYDLSGNMAEWTDETSGGGKHYVLGGSYDSDADDCKIESRESLPASTFLDRVGFRLARTVGGQ